MNFHRYLIFIGFLICSLALGAQDLNRSAIFKEGDKLFSNAQYVKAMRYYKEVLDQEPNHLGALYQMGECYRLMFDYESALYYYEKVANNSQSRFPLARFYYAEMLKHGGEFNQALEGFEQFMNKLKELDLHESSEYRIYYKQARIEKEGCLLALNDLTNPKPDHNFQLCGDEINTEYMDFAAFSYNNDQILCITSSRSSGTGNLIDYRFGESFADIYRYKKVNGGWVDYNDSDNLERTINTKWGDGSGSFNSDATKFYYTNCNEKLGDVCHIYVSSLVNGQWTEPKALGEAINIPDYDSRHPSITPSGDTLFFASNRPGGHGEYDLWMSVSAGGDNWSQPQNLGDQINTPFYEISPFYDADQRALFFSSDGHRGYGGFDIFMAKGASFFDPEIFNPGFPFNSNKDEVFMFVSKNRGYLSSNRDGGFGKLDIYEFEIETEKEIITEISSEESIAGRNSLFSDDYDFDYKDPTPINDIISSFLAAKMVDVDMVLTEELADVYEDLSLDDKERINRIIYARIRQLNERDLQAMRIEDEFYYQDLDSEDKSHMDNLVTSYIEEHDLSSRISLEQTVQIFYSSLNDDNRESADRLIATRVKQANAYEYEPVTYNALPQADQKQVDNLTYKYIQEKTSLDKLTISPAQTYFLRELESDKKEKIIASVKEKLLDLTNDTQFVLTEDDRRLYQALSEEHLEALREIASSFILADIKTLEPNLNPENLKIYRLYNATQQRSLNKILAKIINNTIKADIYFAEANLTVAEKQVINTIPKERFDEFVEKERITVNEESDKMRLKRFLTVYGDSWDNAKTVFMASGSADQVATVESVSESEAVYVASYNFETPDLSGVQEIVVNLLASRMVGVEMPLTAELLRQYNSLSEVDKKRIDKIINARILQLNKRDLQALRIEDELYYDKMPEGQRRELDGLITQYIEEKGLSSSLTMDATEQAFYDALSEAERGRVYMIIADRLKKADDFAYPTPNYEKLSESDQGQVDQLAYEYLEGKTNLEELTIPLQAVNYLRTLSEDKRNQVFASVKEKLLNLANDQKYALREEDKLFYRNLSTQHLEALREIASSFILSDVESVGSNLSPESLAIYDQYEKEQQQILNRILAKIINNTIKADIYVAETHLRNKKLPDSLPLGGDDIDVYKVFASVGEEYMPYLERFLRASAEQWQSSPNIFIPEELPEREEETLPVTMLSPVVEKGQKIETLTSADIQFYEKKPEDEKRAIDRIIAKEFINSEYRDPTIVESDNGFYKALSSTEKHYIKLLTTSLENPENIEPAVKSNIKEAFSYYSTLAPSLKKKWNRVISRSVLVNEGRTYKLKPDDAKYLTSLKPEEKIHLDRLKEFRFANQRILSEDIHVDSKDLANNTVNFGVAKFNNEQHNYVSVRGTLIRNDNGSPLSNFPLLVINDKEETIAKTTTSQNGVFNFEDLPKGTYKVIAGDSISRKGLAAPFFVKGLQVDGTQAGRFRYVKSTNIYFDFDSYELRKEAAITLQEIAELSKKQDIYIELKSHTDAIGADNYNLNLSQKRNDAALTKLKDLGMKGEQIEWLAMGNRSPVAPNNTPYGRQFNRRIEISIKSNKPIEYEPAEIYLVRPQGTLYSISKNFRVDIEEIKEINGLTGNVLKAYSPLRIPNPNNLRPNLDMLVELNESVAISGNSYTVKAGETVTSIASKFNVPEELIMEMNNLTSTKLEAGQKLKIYVRGN